VIKSKVKTSQYTPLGINQLSINPKRKNTLKKSLGNMPKPKYSQKFSNTSSN